jgi:hypothetical protein
MIEELRGGVVELYPSDGTPGRLLSLGGKPQGVAVRPKDPGVAHLRQIMVFRGQPEYGNGWRAAAPKLIGQLESRKRLIKRENRAAVVAHLLARRHDDGVRLSQKVEVCLGRCSGVLLLQSRDKPASVVRVELNSMRSLAHRRKLGRVMVKAADAVKVIEQIEEEPATPGDLCLPQTQAVALIQR